MSHFLWYLLNLTTPMFCVKKDLDKQPFIWYNLLGLLRQQTNIRQLTAHILWRHREGIDQAEGQEVILARAFDIVRQALETGGSAHSPVPGIGVGVPGLVDIFILKRY
jgi:hypothetical protein